MVNAHEKSLAVYKSRPAVVTGFDGEKISIAVLGGESLKVRGKDIEFIHPGPCALKDMEEDAPSGNAREAWELLTEAGTETEGDSPAASLKELAELVYGNFSPRTAWAAWEILKEGLYFTGDAQAIKTRPRCDVEEDEKKREEKQRETGDRAAFLQRFKNLPPFRGNAVAPEISAQCKADRRFLQDVEALALGKTDKSRTLKDLGKSETPEEAHRLLLACGAWTVWENPHPSRFGLTLDSAKIVPPLPPQEKRLDLTNLAAYAIDNSWSDDPDDALSLEAAAGGGYVLWVHVADPAFSITPGSPADIEARHRGATLYLPEGTSRMLCHEVLPFFALGVSRESSAGGGGDVSPALSFKITLNPDITIKETEIFPSLVRVARLTYAEADALIDGGGEGAGQKIAADLSALAGIAERNIERRLDTGAVVLEFPEARIHVSLGGEENKVCVTPVAPCRSAVLVRECMLLAGEGSARWARHRRLPFPYISQEAGELPDQRLEGLAGAWQIRRCMGPRSLSARPGVHWGLGLDEYTQVTSPLRRYTDLLCHQQIRAWLNKNEGGAGEPLAEDEVLLRVSAAEAAAVAANRAERASRAHWLAVYLSDKKDSVWEAVVLDRKGNKGVVMIPALGIETRVNMSGTEKPNDKVSVKPSSINIPEGELGFVL
ncbi:MAG: RNB domain-containing ribonuclease [Treponema sp.]|nr:RNB domain-containing ribonuclease [Treponema sp.]